MIPCPLCSTQARVVDSRLRHGFVGYRRRVCPACGHRFSTYEFRVKGMRAGVSLVEREWTRWRVNGRKVILEALRQSHRSAGEADERC